MATKTVKKSAAKKAPAKKTAKAPAAKYGYFDDAAKEYAFKHGVSSSRPSKIDIRLLQNDDELVFNCDNTNYPKDDADRSGSGIGLENTRRRLDLMYAGRYSWEQSLEENIYHVQIKIRIEN